MSIGMFFSLLLNPIVAPEKLMDYAYGEESELQKMDVFIPFSAKSAGKDSVNIFLYVHGGGWVAGDKNGTGGMLWEYAEKGLVAATINYRMFTEGLSWDQQTISVEDMLDDIDSAITALDSILRERGMTPNKLFIMGHSAGGHLSNLFAYTRNQTSKIPIAFCVNEAGPTDFTDPSYFDFFGEGVWGLLSQMAGEYTPFETAKDSDALKAVSPIFHIDENTPPTIIRHGVHDDIIPFSNAELLNAALDETDIKHDFFIYPNSGHSFNDPLDSQLYKEFNKLIDSYIVEFMGQKLIFSNKLLSLIDL